MRVVQSRETIDAPTGNGFVRSMINAINAIPPHRVEERLRLFYPGVTASPADRDSPGNPTRVSRDSSLDVPEVQTRALVWILEL